MQILHAKIKLLILKIQISIYILAKLNKFKKNIISSEKETWKVSHDRVIMDLTTTKYLIRPQANQIDLKLISNISSNRIILI